MTSSIKWEPIEDLKAICEAVGSVLPWSCTGIGRALSAGRIVSAGRTVSALIPGMRHHALWTIRPAVDVYETGEAFVAEVDAPGLQAADLNVTVSGSRMSIQGEYKAPEGEEPSEAKGYVRRERPTGKFSRTLAVPKDVDVDQIVAKLENGVLVVTMPKATEPEGMTVEVEPELADAAKE